MQTEAALENNSLAVSKPLLRPSRGALLFRDFSHRGPERIKVKLPVGMKTANGGRLHEMWLNSLTGANELMGERTGFDLSIAEWVTYLINNNADPVGEIAEKPGEALCVADRDLLIIYLRVLTFGPEIWGTVFCPHEGCGKQMDVPFDLTDLKMPVHDGGEDILSASFDYQGKETRFTYRQPNGSDQAVISGLLPAYPRRALLVLLSRCLHSLDGLPDITERALSLLPGEMIQRMEEIIAGAVTSFDWDIVLTCPECHRYFISALDIQEYFWEELQISRSDIWKDVHTIALNYHWSEQQILSLTRWKRKLYLEYIQNHLAGA